MWICSSFLTYVILCFSLRVDCHYPDHLTDSEIDRYANCTSESDEYSSGERYRPSVSESSDDENNLGETSNIDNYF